MYYRTIPALNIDLQSWVVSLFVQLMQYALNSCICEFYLWETFTIISISGVLWFWQFLFLFHGTVKVYGFLRDIPVLCSVRSQLFYSTTRSRLCNDVIGSWFLSDSQIECHMLTVPMNTLMHTYLSEEKAPKLFYWSTISAVPVCSSEFDGTTGVSVTLDHRTLLTRSFAGERVFQRVAQWTGTFPIVCWMHTCQHVSSSFTCEYPSFLLRIMMYAKVLALHDFVHVFWVQAQLMWTFLHTRPGW